MTTNPDSIVEPPRAAGVSPPDHHADGRGIPAPADPVVELGGKLAGLSLGRQVAVLAVWPFMQQVLNWFVTAVDTAVAGRLSTEATNAIGVAAYIGWLLGLLSMAVGAGGGALIARAVGGRNRGLANAGLGQALLLAVGWGVLVGAVIYTLAGVIGRAAGLGDESLMLATTYLRILAVAAPMVGVLFVGGMALSAAGDTRSPFWVMVGVNGVNVALTLTLVAWGYGVAGIAVGTAIAWCVGAVITLAVLVRPHGPIRLRRHRLRPHIQTIRRIVRVALPNLVDRFGHWLGNFAVLMIVGYIAVKDLGGEGAALQGAHIVAIRIEAISFLPGMAFGVAAATLAGQYLGAGSPALARRAVVYCWTVGAGLMTLVGVTFVAVPGLWVRLMTDLPALLEVSPELVRMCGWIQVFFGSYLILSEAMRGAGDTRWPMILSNASTWAVRLPAVFFLGVWLELGITGVWLGLCAELTVRGVIFTARFLHGGWLKVKV
ncbi:MAG: MATE family efflux transporter [Planctomycetota bacterium]